MAMRIVSTLVASKPGSTLRSATAVRTSSAEPMSSTRARATSSTTSTARVLFCRNPLPERPLPSLRVVLRSSREAWSAGMSPNRMPVAIDSAIVNARTRQSTVTTEPFSPTRGRPAVFTASSARIPAVPRSRPSAPPANDSMRLSVSSCRMMRPRPAPMAARTAISRLRVVARASSRFATFAQAMSSTKLTAPSSSQSVGRTFATSASRSGSALKNVSRPSALGNLRVYSAAETFSRACACSRVTPRLSRPAA